MSEQFKMDNIRVNIELGKAGLYYGTSPDVRGLLVAGKSRQDVIDKVPDALLELKLAAQVHPLQSS